MWLLLYFAAVELDVVLSVIAQPNIVFPFLFVQHLWLWIYDLFLSYCDSFIMLWPPEFFHHLHVFNHQTVPL